MNELRFECPCGQTHVPKDLSTGKCLEKCIEQWGVTTQVHTAMGCWKVSRVYIYFHGLKSDTIETMAKLYGWEKFECDVAEMIREQKEKE